MQPRSDFLVRRHLDVDVRAVNKEERSVDVVASTDSLDAHGEIVEQKFDLKRYKRNPVVLWNHNRGGFLSAPPAAEQFPIGRAEDVRVEDGKLQARILFASEEANPLAESVFRLMQERMLRAVSIGFRPGKVTEEEDAATGKRRLRLSKNELFEISVVPIPSNPDAIAKAADAELEWLRSIKDSAADGGEQTKDSTMTLEELQARIKKLEADLAVSTSERDKAAAQVGELTKKLEADGALLKRAEADLAKAQERLAKAEAQVIETEIDKYVGTKLTPAERDEHVQLAKDAGLERVKALIEKRPNLTLTDRVKVDGDPLPSKDKAPPPVDGGGSDGSADIVKAASAASTAA